MFWYEFILPCGLLLGIMCIILGTRDRSDGHVILGIVVSLACFMAGIITIEKEGYLLPDSSDTVSAQTYVKALGEDPGKILIIREGNYVTITNNGNVIFPKAVRRPIAATPEKNKHQKHIDEVIKNYLE